MKGNCIYRWIFDIFAERFTQMSWNEIIYGLGDLLAWTFEILPPLGNLPNALFSAVIFGGIVFWLGQLKKYKAKAKQSGGVE